MAFLPLRERKRLRVRRTLADTALDLFGAHGFSRVTVDQLCETAEVSKSSFFRIFPSKEAAAIEAEAELWSAFDTALADLAPGAALFPALVERLGKAALSLPPDWDDRYVRTRKLIVTAPELLAYVAHFRNLVEADIRKRVADVTGVEADDLRLQICCGVLMTTWSFVAREWVMARNGVDRPGFVAELGKAAATTPDALKWRI